jgi:hypothetical protein
VVGEFDLNGAVEEFCGAIALDFVHFFLAR